MKLLKSEIAIMNTFELNDPKEILYLYPYRYDDNELVKFSNWKINDKVFFNGTLLTKPTTAYFNRRSSSRFQVMYDGVIINCTIYNRKWIASLEVGVNINIEGKYSGKNKVTVSNYNTSKVEDNLGMFPVYHLSGSVKIAAYRKFLKKVYDTYINEIEDDLPLSIIEKYKLLSLKQALSFIHFPKSHDQVKMAIRTLKYREFLHFNLSNQILNADRDKEHKTALNFNSEDVYRLANKLDFKLSKDQFTSLSEILYDMQQSKIMNRLLQGDVGSGKTIVAALAMYATSLANKQSALMVPTEILALQQYDYFKSLFKNHELNIVCLYSSLKPFKKKIILEQIKNGVADIIIGTHSLIQDDIEFSDLSFVVIDEQQRFGVNQRSSLFEKGFKTDRLLMSATPIPRTMASVLFSNMDISTIETMPLNRIPIITKVVSSNSMKPILNEVIEKINQKIQVYVVCAAIDDSEHSTLSNVNTIYESLNIELNERRKLNIKIKALHGKLDSKEKEQIMDDFNKGHYDILVSTTVIEVGINVKNANLMVIYNAESFGLSQLHQLRGRVGRGNIQGYTYLLNGSSSAEAKEKLDFVASTTNGFEISEYDLNMRGPGDVIGIRQSGIPNFVLGDLSRDQVMLEYAKNDALEIINDASNREYHAIINNVKDKLRKEKLIES